MESLSLELIKNALNGVLDFAISTFEPIPQVPVQSYFEGKSQFLFRYGVYELNIVVVVWLDQTRGEGRGER